MAYLPAIVGIEDVLVSSIVWESLVMCREMLSHIETVNSVYEHGSCMSLTVTQRWRTTAFR